MKVLILLILILIILLKHVRYTKCVLLSTLFFVARTRTETKVAAINNRTASDCKLVWAVRCYLPEYLPGDYCCSYVLIFCLAFYSSFFFKFFVLAWWLLLYVRVLYVAGYEERTPADVFSLPFQLAAPSGCQAKHNPEG